MRTWLALLSFAFIVSPVIAQEPEESAGGMQTTEAAVTEAAETAPAEVAAPADEAAPVEAASEAPQPRAPRFAVILPERIDHDWYWFLYSDRSQHIVQSAVEKALVRAGLDVIDLETATLPAFGDDFAKLETTAYAVQAGRSLKADYVIAGQATAVKASEGQAYGVNVVRTQAEITAKIIRVVDGKILEVEDASAMEGGQSAQAAGQVALKKAGTVVAGKIARLAAKLPATDTPAK